MIDLLAVDAFRVQASTAMSCWTVRSNDMWPPLFRFEMGKALEDVVRYVLFEKVPGISVTKRNVRNVFDTEEVDVAFFNER